MQGRLSQRVIRTLATAMRAFADARLPYLTVFNAIAFYFGESRG
jgi:hypothetical protein